VCTLADADADEDAGVCAIAHDGTTLACARTFTPPQPAIAACASKTSGDACMLTGHEDHGFTGTCSAGPNGSASVLACRPAGHFPDAAAACANLAAAPLAPCPPATSMATAPAPPTPPAPSCA